MKKLLFLVLLLSTFFGYSQYTLIPDVNFEKALIEKGIDSGPLDGRVLKIRVNTLTDLLVSGKNISNLSGIEDFLNLRFLWCNDNLLTSLNVSKNIALTNLQCGNNQLSTLDVTNNKVLFNLGCSNNKLTSLDISKNTFLFLLDCNSNKLNILDITNNKDLYSLDCYSNQLTNIDTSKNLSLKILDCNSNPLNALDVSNNKDLIILDCVSTKLSTLNLKNGNNTKLTNVDFTNNPNLNCIQVDNKTYSYANWLSKKDAAASFSEDCSKTVAPIAPPEITATGNQTYCPQTKIKIATSVTIQHDPAQPTTDAVHIQISSGYRSGEDVLSLSGFYPNIVSNWIPSEGKLILSNPNGGKVPYSDFETAIKNVEFYNSSLSVSGTRSFSINLGIGQANFLPRNKHFYEYVPAIGITWTDASVAAAAKTYYGLQGYLATLTAADEAQLAGEQASGAGWIGGSDAATEGVWKWVTGPEGLANGGTGITFWNGLDNGSTPNFAFWNTGEPNQSNGTQENYAHVTAPGVGIKGSWNDLTNTGNSSGEYQPKGYIVEYGGMITGDVDTIQISASTTITIPKITSTTPKSICGSGSLTLQATATDGIVHWYTSNTGGISVATGNSFTTPILTTSKSYYVDASNGSCQNGPRTEIIAAVNPIPTITSTTPNSRCNSGTVILDAVASAGTINWYDASSGGTLVGTGNSFTTPNISASTTYYVEATAAGCTTLTRTPILATVNISPTITSTMPNSRCNSGTVTLAAVASAGTINWYDAPSGGTLLGTGTSFTTPNISAPTPYYVEAVAAGCISLRLPVLATVFPVQKLTEEIVLCQNTRATLDASISGMKYLWSPGGEISQTISVSSIGDYSVLISSPLANCDSKKDIKVIEYPKPIIKEIIVAENSIVIQLENPQNYYEYAIDGRLFQDSNQFSYIPSGQHTAIVRDKKTCNSIPQDFTIFTIAKFFTPNNDGYNDVWEIKEMKNFPKSSATVFDRYGKLITTLTASKYWWDGKYINNLLPADDYWYRLKLDDTKPEIKGHFSLKR